MGPLLARNDRIYYLVYKEGEEMSGFADYIDQNTMASDEEIRARSCQHPLERTNAGAK